jgi:hypothetical protein
MNSTWKAISLTQPWATLVAIGAKRIETRSWPTRYRGPIAIHAAKDFPTWCRDLCDTEPFRSVLRARGLGASDLPRGQMLCITTLIDCWPTAKIREKAPRFFAVTPHELEFGNYDDGRFGFIFDEIAEINPVPARGALGIWTWDALAPIEACVLPEQVEAVHP